MSTNVSKEDCACCETPEEAASTPREKLAVACYIAGAHVVEEAKRRQKDVGAFLGASLCARHAMMFQDALRFVISRRGH